MADFGSLTVKSKRFGLTTTKDEIAKILAIENSHFWEISEMTLIYPNMVL